MRVLNELKYFIASSEFKNLLEEDNFKQIYFSANQKLKHSSVGTLTDMFYKFDINPLEYMNEVPDYYNYNRKMEFFDIPNGIKIIRQQAFDGCEKLQKVTIPGSVCTIEQWAFWDCGGLQDINYNGTIGQWHQIKRVGKWNYNTGEYTIHCSDGDIKK